MRKYRQLSHDDHVTLEALLRAGHSKKEIAQALHVHISTVYRAIKRGLCVQMDWEYRTYTVYSAMAADIRKISSDTTAGAGNILYGKTAYAGSKKITGSMPDMGAISYNMPANGSYTIPAGYHNGSGIVSQKIGTQGSQTIIPGTSDKYIGPGKYLTDVQTIKGDANLVPANIIKGKSIFGINGSAEACSKVKLVLGERTVLNSIISKTNISEAYTFTGGPDGIRWYNWRVPDGKVVLNTSGLLNSYVSAYWGAIIRSIDYGTQAQAAGKNGYTYGPLYYDDY